MNHYVSLSLTNRKSSVHRRKDPTRQEDRWDPEPVWKQRLEEKSLDSAGNRTSIARFSSPYPDTILTELAWLLPKEYFTKFFYTLLYYLSRKRILNEENCSSIAVMLM
jgi:hypothetical protein